MTASISIDSALTDPNLLGAALGPIESWQTWICVLRAAFGLELNEQDQLAFEAVAGGRSS